MCGECSERGGVRNGDGADSRLLSLTFAPTDFRASGRSGARAVDALRARMGSRAAVREVAIPEAALTRLKGRANMMGGWEDCHRSDGDEMQRVG